jgi:hypothetical protein
VTQENVRRYWKKELKSSEKGMKQGSQCCQFLNNEEGMNQPLPVPSQNKKIEAEQI